MNTVISFEVSFVGAECDHHEWDTVADRLVPKDPGFCACQHRIIEHDADSRLPLSCGPHPGC